MQNDKLIGDLKAFFQVAVKDYGLQDISIASRAVFNRQAKDESDKLLLKDRDYIFLDFADGSAEWNSSAPIYGKVVIEL